MSIDPVDAAVGEMDADARARADARMREDPGFRRDVEAIQAVARMLEDLPEAAWDPPEPPPLRAVPDAAPAPRRRRRWSVSVPVPALALGAAAVLAGGVAIGSLAGGEDTPAAPAVESRLSLAALPAAPGAHGEADVLDDGELVLRVDGLGPNRAGEFYAVWLLDRSGRMVSVGAFRVAADGTATVRVPLPDRPERFDFVDVSVEPADGDPRHSGRSVLRGDTA
jgi:anti-sigma-K factor RskA